MILIFGFRPKFWRRKFVVGKTSEFTFEPGGILSVNTLPRTTANKLDEKRNERAAFGNRLHVFEFGNAELLGVVVKLWASFPLAKQVSAIPVDSCPVFRARAPQRVEAENSQVHRKQAMEICVFELCSQVPYELVACARILSTPKEHLPSSQKQERSPAINLICVPFFYPCPANFESNQWTAEMVSTLYSPPPPYIAGTPLTNAAPQPFRHARHWPSTRYASLESILSGRLKPIQCAI
ncbi:hypothetical protein B0H19DRAFT_1068405 [Mycena capillaripes]|nr:hypothetical protein B0H19DRAFT_1068405 [Mycena capillaripes]